MEDSANIDETITSSARLCGGRGECSYQLACLFMSQVRNSYGRCLCQQNCCCVGEMV